jgi:ATP-dependent Clp protease ATP-binding subunit ClpC
VSQLPSRPSLSHLRKQAKDLLRELRRRKRGVTLVEAQHALARQYGFASWPKLKVHAERLAALPGPVTFQRYTSKAREAVFFSRHEAGQLGSRTIEPEHVLLGLIRASEGLKGRIFDRPALALDRARILLTSGRPTTDPLPPTVRMSTGDRAQQIFRAAAEEADALKHHDIGLAHLLLGVLREPASEAATLLDRTGVRFQSVRDAIAALLNEEPL